MWFSTAAGSDHGVPGGASLPLNRVNKRDRFCFVRMYSVIAFVLVVRNRTRIYNLQTEDLVRSEQGRIANQERMIDKMRTIHHNIYD